MVTHYWYLFSLKQQTLGGELDLKKLQAYDLAFQI